MHIPPFFYVSGQSDSYRALIYFGDVYIYVNGLIYEPYGLVY